MLGRLWLAVCALAFAFGSVAPATAQQTEARIALVIGNAAYQAGELKTPANDAGLIAQTLQAAGFDVVGARDLDQDSLRRAFRDFLQKAQSSGPNTVAFVYLSGYGLQLEGENYFVPIDARIAHDTDIPVEALRLSDYTRPLAALRLKASIVVLDAARPHPFAASGQPLAGGLALTEAEPGMLIAFNAMPGTVATETPDAYGSYARALAEMLREGGLPLPAVFDRVRLRVNEMTQGAEIPWHASKVEGNVVFFERAPDAPAPAVSSDQMMAMRTRPIGDFGAQEAYLAALDRDTLQGYLDFLAAFPDDPMAKRVRAIVAARREAITWRRTRNLDTPQAYWSYLRRYPNGPHAYDARRRLAFLSVALEPPPTFAMVDYEVAPPPPEEVVYVDRPVLAFGDPGYGFAPPPPPPVYFLPPQPAEFVVVPPPPAPIGLFLLPTPIYRPVPAWVRPPTYVAPPPNNVIYNNVHNTVVINNTTNMVTVTNPAGQTSTVTPAVAAAPRGGPGAAPGAVPGGAAPGVGPGARPQPGAPVPAVASVGPALPPSVQQKAISIQRQGGPRAPGAPGAAPGQPLQPGAQPGQPLPGAGARPPLPPSAALPPASAQPRPGAIPGATTPGVSPGTIAPPPGAVRQPPGAGQPQPPGAPAPGIAGRPPQSPTGTPAPGTPAPSANVAPSATPPAGQSPASRPQGGPRPGIAARPPAGGPPPGAAPPRPPGSPPSPAVNRPTPPPPVARQTPPNAPPAASQPPAHRPPPPPAVVNRPPPSPPPAARPAPPPQVVNRPPPAAAPPRPAAPPPPPPPRVAAPPRPAAPPPAAKPPQCPPGKTFQNGACK